MLTTYGMCKFNIFKALNENNVFQYPHTLATASTICLYIGNQLIVFKLYNNIVKTMFSAVMNQLYCSKSQVHWLTALIVSFTNSDMHGYIGHIMDWPLTTAVSVNE